MSLIRSLYLASPLTGRTGWWCPPPWSLSCTRGWPPPGGWCWPGSAGNSPWPLPFSGSGCWHHSPSPPLYGHLCADVSAPCHSHSGDISEVCLSACLACDLCSLCSTSCAGPQSAGGWGLESRGGVTASWCADITEWSIEHWTLDRCQEPGRETQAASTGHYVILSQSGNNKHFETNNNKNSATLSAKTINISTELNHRHNVTVRETWNTSLNVQRPSTLFWLRQRLNGGEGREWDVVVKREWHQAWHQCVPLQSLTSSLAMNWNKCPHSNCNGCCWQQHLAPPLLLLVLTRLLFRYNCRSFTFNTTLLRVTDLPSLVTWPVTWLSHIIVTRTVTETECCIISAIDESNQFTQLFPAFPNIQLWLNIIIRMTPKIHWQAQRS